MSGRDGSAMDVAGTGGRMAGRDGSTMDVAGTGGTPGPGGHGGTRVDASATDVPADRSSLCGAGAGFDRSCASDGDCVVAAQNGCYTRYVGIRASELDRFNIYQQMCNPPPSHTSGGCDSAPLPPVVDDGSQIFGAARAAVTCRAGTCTTYSSLCGQACGSGTSCFTCSTAAGPTFAACTARCSTVTTCQDPAFPSCQTTSVFIPPLTSIQPTFCVPQNVVCRACDTCAVPPDAGTRTDARRDGPTP